MQAGLGASALTKVLNHRTFAQPDLALFEPEQTPTEHEEDRKQAQAEGQTPDNVQIIVAAWQRSRNAKSAGDSSRWAGGVLRRQPLAAANTSRPYTLTSHHLYGGAY